MYLEPGRTSTMEFFLQKYLTALSCSLFSEKRLHHRCLTELKIDFCYRSEILSLLLFLVYKLSRENTQPVNICDIVFEKAQGCAGKVDKTSVYAEAALRRFFKNRFMRNFAEFAKKKKKKKSAGTSFLVKLSSLNLQLR